jgi:hypothetical protein
MEALVECTQTYIGTHKVVAGTTATIEGVGGIYPVKLRIKEPKEGTEFHPGETYDVPQSDFQKFWRVLQTASDHDPDAADGGDRGKVGRQGNYGFE